MLVDQKPSAYVAVYKIMWRFDRLCDNVDFNPMAFCVI